MRSTLIVMAILTACGQTVPTQSGSPSHSASPSPSVPAAAHGVYGVMASQGGRPDTASEVSALKASWVRVNIAVTGSSSDTANANTLLASGSNLIVTLTYRNPSNVDTSYGSPADWPKAGFPFVAQPTFDADIHAVVADLNSHRGGRDLYIQAENEVSDVTVANRSEFWRGTDAQYLTLESALYDDVKAVDSAIQVALFGFTYNSLQTVTDPTDPHYQQQQSRLRHILGSARYDVADLHFYGCDDSISAEAKWVTDNLGAHGWISTENGGPTPMCAGAPSWQNQNAFETAEATEVSVRLPACAAAGGRICLWFSLFDLTGEVDSFNHLGLIDPRSTPTRHRPAYGAFQELTASSH